MEAGRNRLIGTPVPRKEDSRFLRGTGTYVDDIPSKRALYAAFFRSDVAHGDLLNVDVDAALKLPGVVAVYTWADIQPFVKPILAESEAPEYQNCSAPVLAAEKVFYVGQPIAIVVAESRYEAEDGVDLISADLDILAPVLDIDTADQPGAPVVHPDIPDNLYNHFELEAGAVDAAFQQADFSIELECRNGRCAPVPMESRAILADWDPDLDEIHVWASHQAPHVFRTGLSEFLDVPEARIRVVSPDVGGGFGAKLIVYPEDLATIAASRLLRRPVKWTADRRDDLLTTMHGREQIHRISAAVTNEGRITAVKTIIKSSNGGYAVWPFTAALDAGQASENVTGPYDIQNYRREVYSVVTNKAPMGPYRGVGRVSACFAIERVIDEVARKLELDPLEVRRRNVIREYPYMTAAELELESGSSAESLDLMEKLLDLPALRQEHARLRAEGVYRGVGMAAVVEHTALGPQEVSKKGIEMVLGFEVASLRIEPDGHVTAIVGTHNHGQGHETTFSQVVADALGIGLDQITVRFGDTAVAPYGLGTWASRSLVYGGGALLLAAHDIKQKMLRIAAHVSNADVAALAYRDGSIVMVETGASIMSFEEVARIANHRANELPDNIDPGLEITRRYRAPDPGTFSNSLHAVEIEVDTVTGQVQILRYVVIEDCGTIVNPMIVDGQLCGGIAQGIGQALLEEAVYDDFGQPLAVTLADYLVPVASDIPPIEIHHLETPSPHSLGGFKGMGEGGAINAPAAIANAVTDALSPFGVQANHTPITPHWIAAAVSESTPADLQENEVEND